MEQVSTVGLDLAKNVFQVHGVDEAGEVVVRRQLRRSQVHPFLQETAAVSGRHRGLRDVAPLGSRAAGARA